jgi:hypothetical protein
MRNDIVCECECECECECKCKYECEYECKYECEYECEYEYVCAMRASTTFRVDHQYKIA